MTPLGIRFFQTSLAEESALVRVTLLRQSAELFRQSPIIGVGIHNFLPSLAEISPTLPYRSLQPVHNIVVLYVVETGLLGLGVLLLLLRRLKIWLYFGKHYPGNTALLYIIGGIGMVDHYFLTLHQGQLLLALMVGFIFASPINTASFHKLGVRSKGKYPNANKTRKTSVTSYQPSSENSSKRASKIVKT
jgi:O-antigen ligase